jgi:hypothetical protein
MTTSRSDSKESSVSDHWYDQSGKPCYDQATQKGGLRPTDLRDARKLGLCPSVTTVLSVWPKPQLEAWKVRQGILAALTLSRAPEEGDDSYLARVLADSKAQAQAAADEGTRIHDAIECAFKGKVFPGVYRPHVDAVMLAIGTRFPTVQDWVPERSFAHPSGFGGKVDLHSPSTGIVIDYKGKDGDFSDGKKLAYDQNIQLAAYQRGLGLPENACANVFVSRTHPGKVAMHVWSPEDIDEGAEDFFAALAFWKRLKRFDPRFALAQAA